MACTKRIVYFRSLGGLTESVPDDVNLHGDGGIDIDTEIKNFVRSLCRLKGITPQDLTSTKRGPAVNNIREKTIKRYMDTPHKILSRHLGISQPSISIRKKNLREIKEKRTPKKTRSESKELTLYFENYPEILEQLEAIATAKLRTTKAQALYIIIKHIEKTIKAHTNI